MNRISQIVLLIACICVALGAAAELQLETKRLQRQDSAHAALLAALRDLTAAQLATTREISRLSLLQDETNHDIDWWSDALGDFLTDADYIMRQLES